jgi:hypothetical protein
MRDAKTSPEEKVVTPQPETQNGQPDETKERNVSNETYEIREGEMRH